MTVVAPVATTLVTGATASAREQAIAELLGNFSSEQTLSSVPPRDAIILEGIGMAATPLVSDSTRTVVRIAPGCLCCAGNLVLRVTLNRLLRQQPSRLFIGLASSEHLDQLRSWLQAPPYDQLLAPGTVVMAGPMPDSPAPGE